MVLSRLVLIETSEVKRHSMERRCFAAPRYSVETGLVSFLLINFPQIHQVAGILLSFFWHSLLWPHFSELFFLDDSCFGLGRIPHDLDGRWPGCTNVSVQSVIPSHDRPSLRKYRIPLSFLKAWSGEIGGTVGIWNQSLCTCVVVLIYS